MKALEAALRRAASDLRALGARWALVGGLAVATRAEPRTTRDVDFAVAVSSEGEADRLILSLRPRGYRELPNGVRLRFDGKLALIRLLPPGSDEGGVVVDLLFDLARIEKEVVAAADPVFVATDLVVPVASVGHLLALKVLASRATRPMDLFDARKLLAVATDLDLKVCRDALELITQRGGNEGKDLLAELRDLLAQDPRTADL